MRASIVLLLLCGCASGSSSSRTAGPTPGSAAAASISGAGGPAATAVIEPRSGSTLTGSASFTAVDGGNLGAHVEVQNGTPGQHGVHIHEKGDCSDPKAASAGGHYNPNSGPHHGGPSTPVRHGGEESSQFGHKKTGSSARRRRVARNAVIVISIFLL